MLKNKLYYKSGLIISILFLLLSSTNTQKAEAFLDPFSGPIFGIEVSEKVRKTISDIKDYINQAQQVANTYKSSKALIKQVTDAGLQNFAMNNSASQILNFGQAAVDVLTGDQGIGINVNTGGDQIITNLGNYLDKVNVNEIRKGLSDLGDITNQTPFTNNIKQQLVDFARNIGDTKAGKLITFNLPYIARAEICNDPNLKNVIKNGEPENYINRKKAVANVDIDKACQTPNLMSPEDQATFVSLAKAGYGGFKTDQALADPANTESAVAASGISKIKDLMSNTEDITTKQVTANDLVIGQQSCFDKSGQLVDFDPASKDSNNMICYNTETAKGQSPVEVKNRIASALLAPYFSMLARAQSTTANACNFSGSSNSGGSGIPNDIPTGKDLEQQIQNQSQTLSPMKMPTPSTQGNLHRGFFEKIFASIFQIASAQSDTLGAVNDILGDVNKGISCASTALSAGTNLMNTIVGTLNIGASNAAKTFTNEDNPYSRLADNFDAIVASQNNQQSIYNQAALADKQYQNGETGYTIDDLKQAVQTYQDIRQINTDKLNDMVFTYAFVTLAIANNKAAMPRHVGCSFFSCKNRNINDRTIANVKDSITGLQEAAISLNKDINALIKEMARDNYKEQQINKLYNQFLNTDTRAEDNQDSLSSVLADAYTSKDYANINADWNYVPRFSDGSMDPSTITPIDPDLGEKEKLQEEARQTKALILPTEEREGPYNMNNLDNLRLRAWQIFQRSINPYQESFHLFFIPLIQKCYTPASSISALLTCTNGSASTTEATKINDLFSRYGMTAIKYVDPNLPRPSQKNVVNVLDPDKIKTWSEVSFCNNLGLANTICNANNGIELLKDYTDTLNDGNPTSDQIDGFCSTVNKDVNTAVDQQCLNATDPDLIAQCKDTNQRQTLITEAQSYCADPTAVDTSVATDTTPQG